ncbi:MAG: hypothetical protein AAGM36_14755 [Cyanobacteria bacterium J06597_1]
MSPTNLSNTNLNEFVAVYRIATESARRSSLNSWIASNAYLRTHLSHYIESLLLLMKLPVWETALCNP